MGSIIIRIIKNKCLYLVILSIMSLSFYFGCRESSTNPTNIIFVSDNEINRINFTEHENGFSIKFSNVWYDKKNLFFKIPIFNGTEGNVRLSQLEKKRKAKDLSILGSMYVEVEKGKIKRSIIDCIKFYKTSLLKNTNIDKPSVIGLESAGMFIWYDFDYEGLPGTIMIGVAYDPNCEKGKYKCKYELIDDIEVDENAWGFTISIGLGEKSYWREEKEKGE